MEILRNMWRRKVRTTLTIFGIAVGVFAFAVLGAMAEKMNYLVDGGVKYLTGQIAVGPKTANFGGLLPADKVAEIRKVKGVDLVQPTS